MPSLRASATFTAARKPSITKPAVTLGDSRPDRIGDPLNEVGFGHPSPRRNGGQALLSVARKWSDARALRQVDSPATPSLRWAPAASSSSSGGATRTSRLTSPMSSPPSAAPSTASAGLPAFRGSSPNPALPISETFSASCTLASAVRAPSNGRERSTGDWAGSNVSDPCHRAPKGDLYPGPEPRWMPSGEFAPSSASTGTGGHHGACEPSPVQ